MKRDFAALAVRHLVEEENVQLAALIRAHPGPARVLSTFLRLRALPCLPLLARENVTFADLLPADLSNQKWRDLLGEIAEEWELAHIALSKRARDTSRCGLMG